MSFRAVRVAGFLGLAAGVLALVNDLFVAEAAFDTLLDGVGLVARDVSQLREHIFLATYRQINGRPPVPLLFPSGSPPAIVGRVSKIDIDPLDARPRWSRQHICFEV